MARVDATYRSRMRTIGFNTLPAAYDPILSSAPLRLVNSRVALRHVNVAGAHVELAGWVKNLTNADNPTFPIYYSFAGSATYERARTYVADPTIEF